MKKEELKVTKLSKKVMSLAVATFVTVSSVFSGNAGNVDTAKAATTDTVKHTYTVHFKMPSAWTQTPTLYAYSVKEDAAKTLDRPLGIFPGKKMTKENTSTSDKWYSTTVTTTVDYAEVIFSDGGIAKGTQYEDPYGAGKVDDYIVTNRYPDAFVTDSNGNVVKDKETGKPMEKRGFTITSDVWFDPATMTEPSTKNPSTVATATPSTTSTVKPTASASTKPSASPSTAPTSTTTTAPIVVPTVEPVTGPQVSADVESNDVVNGNYFYEEYNDYINVKVNLAEGATSATYSIDNGPEKTITEPTTVKVGEGKIANSAVTLTVKSTDGKTTNVQNFTYFKATKVEAPKKLSTAMFKLFNTVSTLANGTEVTADATNVNAATTIPVHFAMPAEWTATNNVYVYAYYDETSSDGTTKTVKPLKAWPGTKATKDSNGYWSIDVPTGSDGTVRVIFTSVTGEAAATATLSSSGEYYYECESEGQLPDGYETDKDGNKVKDEYGNDIPANGFLINEERWYTGAKYTTVNPNATATPTATPTTKPTATPTTAPTAKPTVAPTLSAYFGAEKSAPQYNTTKQTISAVAVNATGTVTYSFTVDGKVIYQGENNSTTWDASQLEAGSHTLTAVITDSSNASVGRVKTYELVKETPVATPVVTATASAIPTVVPTVVPTATAIATVTPSAIPTVTPSAIPTVTASAIPTATPTAIPTIEPTAVVVPTPDVPNGDSVVTPAALSGTISFSKTGKTAGETITIKAKGKNGTPKYKYTYYVVKGSKKTKLASNTTKTSVQWTPAKAGTYTIKVKITDAAKKSKTISKKYKVKARVITIKAFKTNKKSGQKVKTKITLTAKATTKKGKVSYKFAVQKGNGKIKTIKGYSSKAKKVWKPTKKGTYTLYVYVKNGKGVTVAKTKKFVVK